jgi:hypothetical protein
VVVHFCNPSTRRLDDSELKVSLKKKKRKMHTQCKMSQKTLKEEVKIQNYTGGLYMCVILPL